MNVRRVLVLVISAVLTVVVVWGAASREQTQQASARTMVSESSLPSPSMKRVLVIGDSYSAGVGASSTDNSWIGLVARHQGWQVSNMAIGGTGYLASPTGDDCLRPSCPAYGAVLQNVDTRNFDLVLISGGRNDVGESARRVTAAIESSLSFAAARFGASRVIVSSAVWDSRDAPPQVSVINRDIASVCQQRGLTYVDLGEPLRDRPDFLTQDGIHPNDAGHAALADAFLRRVSTIAS